MIALCAASAQAGPARPEEVRAAIDGVLSGSEFHRGETYFERLQAWVVEFLEGLFPEGSIGSAALADLAQVFVWIVLVSVLCLAAWAVLRSLRSARTDAGSPAPEDPRAARARRVAELRSQARAADERGDHVLALRLEFTALVVGLGERGDLEYRDAYTNRELLERGRPGREAQGLLAPIVPELDRKSFGGESATHADFVRLAALCDRLLPGARAGAPAGAAT